LATVALACAGFTSGVVVAKTASGAPITKRFLLSFHACDTATVDDCGDPGNHRVYLAESDDGANWSMVSGWTPHQGSVPDVIRRGETIYVYTPGQVRRFRMETNTWEDPVLVALTDPEADSFVDPSLIVDEAGRLALFYLVGIIGQDPAGCAASETSCIKHFRSATEVPGSDGSRFVADEGDRASVTLFAPDTASDPDIFFDGTSYVLYISRGNSVQLYTSPTLRGTYALFPDLPDGFLTWNIGGVGSGLFNTDTSQYWTYAHIPISGSPLQKIRRAVHDTLGARLEEGDFVDVVTGESIGLGSSFLVASPGIAAHMPGSPPPAMGASAFLPTGQVGVAYSATLQISGGVPPYIVTVLRGSLPTGLSLDNNGAIAGTPTEAGASLFSVRVADQVGASVRKTFVLLVF
jgi:hypothetical protein